MRPVALALAVLAGCEPGVDRSPGAALRDRSSPAPFAPPQGFARLRLVVAPSLSPERTVVAHQLLADHLSRTLSVDVAIDVPVTAKDLASRVEAGAFDLVELPPLQVTEVPPAAVECVAQAIVGGASLSSAYIVVRDDSPVRSLEDLKGTRFGFVDTGSTFGYLLPRRVLREAGIDVEGDLVPVFLGSPEAVLEAVHEGSVEAGATSQGSLGALRRLRGIDPLGYRVIGKSARAPHTLWCVRPALPAVVREAVTAALRRLDTRERRGRSILDPLGINGFTAPAPAAYEVVRRMLERESGP